MKNEWTLLMPENKKRVLSVESHTFEDMPAGRYTLIAKPPQGATGKVNVYEDGTLTKSVEVPQISFDVVDGGHVRVRVTFTFTLVGTVGVSTNPSGLEFTMKGPNESVYEGKTPIGYIDVPIGLYTVTLKNIEGCITSKPQSHRLENGGRVNFQFTLSCEELKEQMEEEVEKMLEFVTVKIEGRDIIFHDVPMERWYAKYVFEAARTGIISGYRDAGNNLTGKYGPSDNVTIGQLLKIAHRVAGINENEFRDAPQNLRARDAWFSPFFTSAEKRFWQIVLDKRIDPSRPATRGEVVATLLQVFDVPREWPKGELFSDVQPTTKYAAAIETAASQGVIAGYSNEGGTATGKFGPEDPINRAEIAKIVSLAIQLYIEDSPEITGESRG